MRVSADGLGEISFSEQQVEAMEWFAKQVSMRDYFFLALLGRRGLRISESLQVTRERLQNNGVLVRVKGGRTVLKVLPSYLYKELVDYSEPLPKIEQIVPIGRRQGYNICLKYAKMAGVENWKRAHPHRWRAYFGTHHARRTGRDPWKVKSLMGHKDLRSTAIYVDDLSPEEEQIEVDEI